MGCLLLHTPEFSIKKVTIKYKLIILTSTMEKGIVITLGLIIGYLLFRFMWKQRNVTNAAPDVLANDKYKVKGQWDR